MKSNTLEHKYNVFHHHYPRKYFKFAQSTKLCVKSLFRLAIKLYIDTYAHTRSHAHIQKLATFEQHKYTLYC